MNPLVSNKRARRKKLRKRTSTSSTTARNSKDWTKVGGKKKKKKIRPGIIIISKKESMFYADIFRKIKADPKLTDIGGSLSHIRRTQKKSCGKTWIAERSIGTFEEETFLATLK